MKRSSPTKPLGGAGVITTKNARTQYETDGMPRRNSCRSTRTSDPTHSRALRLIAAEAADRLRRLRRRESVRGVQRNRMKAENPAIEFALHTNDEVREEER